MKRPAGETAEEPRREGEIAPGVEELEHTADLAVRIRARSRAQLFHRAALAAEALLRGGSGEEGPEGGEVAEVEVRAPDAEVLLVRWLREVLRLVGGGDRAYRDAEFVELGDGLLRARVSLVPASRPPVRELKGVTYHGLDVASDAEGWRATVVFDI